MRVWSFWLQTSTNCQCVVPQRSMEPRPHSNSQIHSYDRSNDEEGLLQTPHVPLFREHSNYSGPKQLKKRLQRITLDREKYFNNFSFSLTIEDTFLPASISSPLFLLEDTNFQLLATEHFSLNVFIVCPIYPHFLSFSKIILGVLQQHQKLPTITANW